MVLGLLSTSSVFANPEAQISVVSSPGVEKTEIPGLKLDQNSFKLESPDHGASSTAVARIKISGTLSEYCSSIIFENTVVNHCEKPNHPFRFEADLNEARTLITLVSIDDFGTVTEETFEITVPKDEWDEWSYDHPSRAVRGSHIPPWLIWGVLSAGVTNSTASENLAGNQSNTSDRISFPSLEATLYVRKRIRQSSTPGVYTFSPWETFLRGAFQENPGFATITFPVTYGFELGETRKNIYILPASIFPSGIDFGVSLRTEQIVNGTPDLALENATFTVPTLPRKTQVLWALANLQFPFRIVTFPFKLALGAGHSLAGSSSADSDIASFPHPSGSIYRASLGFQLGSLFHLPFGIEGRFEHISLSNGGDSLTQSTYGALLNVGIF
jgi:hypothetical protein